MTFQTQHLANIITIARILGVGLIFWLTPYTTNLWMLITIVIYTLICVTDFLDGWIARELKIVSEMGKVLDPLADKILVLVFLPLLEMQVITSFPVFIILAREFSMMALRVAAAQKGTGVIAAQLSGKLKTAITFPVCGILLARVPVRDVAIPLWLEPVNYLRLWVVSWPNWFISLLIYATVAITIWSFFSYFGSFIWQQFRKRYDNDDVKAKRALRSLIPNAVSMLNLGFGITAVILAAFGSFHIAVILVILGIVLDALDGTLARKLDAYSTFGARLDSKADFMSFAVAPAVVIWRVMSEYGGYWGWVGIGIGAVYYAAVHYRLKRFDQSGHSPYFDGLPSPVGAMVVVLASISVFLSQIPIYIGILISVSGLMASRISYPHFNIAVKRRFFKLMLAAAFVFMNLTILKLLNLPYAKSSYAYEVFFGLTCVYVLSPISLLFKKSSQKK